MHFFIFFLHFKSVIKSDIISKLVNVELINNNKIINKCVNKHQIISIQYDR